MRQYMVLPELHFVISPDMRKKQFCPYIEVPNFLMKRNFKLHIQLLNMYLLIHRSSHTDHMVLVMDQETAIGVHDSSLFLSSCKFQTTCEQSIIDKVVLVIVYNK